jgi:hypothetical protein
MNLIHKSFKSFQNKLNYVYEFWLELSRMPGNAIAGDPGRSLKIPDYPGWIKPCKLKSSTTNIINDTVIIK